MVNRSISEQKRQQDGWRPARLIPTSGIKGVDDQETRATSALLSVMMAVPEFARTLLKKVDAPAGTVRTYIEVPIPKISWSESLASNQSPWWTSGRRIAAVMPQLACLDGFYCYNKS
jgi:hypothetical protein